MTLKSELKAIDYDGIVRKNELGSLIEKMLDNIGTTDPELRDTLIYNTFGKLIMENYLTETQMEQIINACRNRLFLGIEEIKSDLVFTRSFSSLVICLILKKDGLKPFIQEEDVQKTIAESLRYLNLEKDIRGYVDKKGWAHSIAHGADLLAAAIRHPSFNKSLSFDCLDAIRQCLFKETTTNTPFIDDEEERLIFVIEALMEKGITHGDIVTWTEEVSNTLNDLKLKEGYSLNFFWKRSNVINLLRGMYFRLLYKDECSDLRKNIVDILRQWHYQLYSPGG